jgi:hypothetical protein
MKRTLLITAGAVVTVLVAGAALLPQLLTLVGYHLNS